MLVTQRTTEAMDVLVATELVVAVRALNLAGRTPAGAGLQPLFAAATDTLPAGAEDRAFGQDVEAARGLLRESSSIA